MEGGKHSQLIIWPLRLLKEFCARLRSRKYSRLFSVWYIPKTVVLLCKAGKLLKAMAKSDCTKRQDDVYR
jgi:hypothetical protein